MKSSHLQEASKVSGYIGPVSTEKGQTVKILGFYTIRVVVVVVLEAMGSTFTGGAETTAVCSIDKD